MEQNDQASVDETFDELISKLRNPATVKPTRSLTDAVVGANMAIAVFAVITAWFSYLLMVGLGIARSAGLGVAPGYLTCAQFMTVALLATTTVGAIRSLGR